MADFNLGSWVEELAEAIVLADASDERSIQKLLSNLAIPAGAAVPHALLQITVDITGLLLGVLAGEAEDPDDVLAAVSRTIDEVQEAVSKGRPLPSAESRETPTIQVSPVVRDQETIELFGDFLQEAEEGLAAADEILVAAERSAADQEGINALFRVFHTIKGVAGFLELSAVASLAHITETLLNQTREGLRSLEGTTLDLVFDGTGFMRKLLEGIRQGIETGTSFVEPEGIAELVRKMEREIEGEPEGNAELAEAGATGKEIPAQEAPLPGTEAAPRAPAVAREIPAPEAPSPETDAAPPAPAVAREIPAPEAPSPGTDAATPALTVALEGPAPWAPLPETDTAPTAPTAAPEVPPRGSMPAASQRQPAGARIRETLKVDVERVDSMVEMIGELIIVESMVVHAPEIKAVESLQVRNYLGQLTKISRDLQDVAMRMRMVPVQGVFLKMQRMVRELSRKTSKVVELSVSGEGTEMDRSMVERIEDPLVHMIRNAMDHGLESANERRASGKSETGVIRLSAYHEGGSVVVEIADDGRGLDREKILAKALRQGIVREGEHLGESEIYMLIFAPGFSTAAQVTEISGRGVGMDVVKRNVEAMRGRVMVSSTAGQGSVFKLILPLTLAIIDGMIVACGSERYIIPSLSIIESLQPGREMLSVLAGNQELLNVRGEVLPLFRLSKLFGITDAQEDPTSAIAVVVESMGQKVGLLVDDVVTQQQVVIKPLGAGMGDTETFSGGAILSDGRVGLILNIDRICVNVTKYAYQKH